MLKTETETRTREVPNKKICRLCNKRKLQFKFYRDSRNSDGLSGWCKSCQKKKTRRAYKVRSEGTIKFKRLPRKFRGKNKVKYKDPLLKGLEE